MLGIEILGIKAYVVQTMFDSSSGMADSCRINP